MNYFRYLLDEANELHRRLTAMIIWLGIIVAISSAINLWHKELNGIIGFFVTAIMLWGITKPEVLIAKLTLKKLSNRGTTEGTTEEVKISKNHLMSVITWTSAIFVFASTLEFKQNFGAVIVALPAIMVVALAEYGWDYKTHFARPFAFGYAAIVLIVCFLNGVPKGIWYRTIGTNPISANQINDQEKILIDAIEKLEKRGATTPQEIANLALWKKQLKERSWLNSATSFFNSSTGSKTAIANAAPEKTTPAAQTAPAAKVSSNEYRVYGPGAYNFKLAAGQESGWITFEAGKMINYNLSSSDYGYKLVYDDGEIVQDGPNVTYPNKFHDKFKLVAITDQPNITFKVREGKA